jgi:hypothetical protein
MRAAEGSNRSRILVFPDPKKDRKTGDTDSRQDATLGGITSQFANLLWTSLGYPFSKSEGFLTGNGQILSKTN